MAGNCPKHGAYSGNVCTFCIKAKNQADSAGQQDGRRGNGSGSVEFWNITIVMGRRIRRNKHRVITWVIGIEGPFIQQ
ncbi:hypothetical protein PG988_006231 [Apiospora saccharicola]